MSFSLRLFCCQDVTPTPEPDSVAYVSLYHMSPDAPPLGIRVDNNRINFNPFNYTGHTGYLRFFTDDRELLFTPFNASNTLLQTTISLEEDKLYSVFVSVRQPDERLSHLASIISSFKQFSAGKEAACNGGNGKDLPIEKPTNSLLMAFNVLIEGQIITIVCSNSMNIYGFI